MPPKGIVRVRMAPSPTGFFHVGSARTALFNWLFAKKYKGAFILRIEDTDTERSEEKYEKDILESMRWLGLEWDEFYRQSERGQIYKKYLERLVHEGHAYYCFCTKEELEGERQGMLAEGIAPKYGGKCRSIPKAVAEKMVLDGKPSVIRFKMPDKKISWTDLVKGKVSFDSVLIGDIVIAKNFEAPVYNFAAAIDDYEMRISHVIRAEDHLANTPKQIAIQQALGLEEIHYAHLPLILNPDRSKMSKRFSATAVLDYRNEGYLPEALINFIAILGWHPEGDRELFSKEELIDAFTIERVQKAGAIFNEEKLKWLNSQYLKKLPEEEFLKRIESNFPLPGHLDKSVLAKIVGLIKERMHTFSDFKVFSDFFFKLPEYEKNLLVWKETPAEEISSNLNGVFGLVSDLEPKKFTVAALRDVLEGFIKERGRGEVLWPLRVAVSGKDASPGPFEIMEILGKEESLARIEKAIKKMAEKS